MSTTTISLVDLINKAEEYLRNNNYAENTINRYKATWNKLYKFSFEGDRLSYVYEASRFVLMKAYRITNNQTLTSSQRFHMRCLRLLDEISCDNDIKRCYHKKGVEVTSEFSHVLEHYIRFVNTQGLSPKTVITKRIQMVRFLNYIKKQNLYSINELNTGIIIEFVTSLDKFGYSSSTKSGMLFTLRHFLRFLYENNYCELQLHELYPIIFTNKQERLPSYYSEENLFTILSIVNRDTSIGIRNYIILILAIQLGIRAGDIRLMKLNNIHWEKGTIEFVQQKTKNPIQLPLSENIKYALLDYLKNSRASSNSQFIFLRSRAPYEPFCSSNSFHYIVTRYLKDCGINYTEKKHGLHSMRHSLASNLLKKQYTLPSYNWYSWT